MTHQPPAISGNKTPRVAWRNALRQQNDFHWVLPQTYKTGMRVPGLVFASDELIDNMADDDDLQQIANVAMLPGIVRYSLAMPDVHSGYGFPIGGVAAMRLDGVISPGGMGYDINCGTPRVDNHSHRARHRACEEASDRPIVS